MWDQFRSTSGVGQFESLAFRILMAGLVCKRTNYSWLLPSIPMAYGLFESTRTSQFAGAMRLEAPSLSSLTEGLAFKYLMADAIS
ncbi:hypothetical protein CYJ10_24725 [Cupriavidus pauculus]|uniref:Uncharacterized protein n=1 Tax=Cupriavidus pauculus TaxID=82633 RepID=A0A2N5C6Y8_9BURK|nr:hypothetical protein CYJ10_24725 [Cupriavidus pauculus]